MLFELAGEQQELTHVLSSCEVRFFFTWHVSMGAGMTGKSIPCKRFAGGSGTKRERCMKSEAAETAFPSECVKVK